MRTPNGPTPQAGRPCDARDFGTALGELYSVPLMHGAERIGELVVGARVGSRRLRRLHPEALGGPGGDGRARHRARRGTADFARTRVVSAREEERRRLRRDLHDGLGSALSGIAFMADAARNYVRPQPQEAIELLTRLRQETTNALEDVRRLVYDLGPARPRRPRSPCGTACPG